MQEPRVEGDAASSPIKPSMAKTSSKLFFIRRLRGRKPKGSSSSSKVFQDSSTCPIPNTDALESKVGCFYAFILVLLINDKKAVVLFFQVGLAMRKNVKVLDTS